MSLFLFWLTKLKYILFQIISISMYFAVSWFEPRLVINETAVEWTEARTGPQNVSQSVSPTTSQPATSGISSSSLSQTADIFQNLFLRYQPKHDFAIENGLKCFLRCHSSYQNVSLGSCITLNWWVDGTQQQGYTALQLQFLSLNQFWT